jgi:serine phosphatase RsbU (regulator of sigma subunit)
MFTMRHETRERPAFHNFQHESALVIAVVRVGIIILAVLAPWLTSVSPENRRLIIAIATGAMVYNTALMVSEHLLKWHWRGRRLAMLAIDLLLTTAWVYLSWQTVESGGGGSPLFPLYYVVVLVGALWYGVPGALGTAGAVAVFYLPVLYRLSDSDPFQLIEGLFREIIYVFLVAIVAGYVVDTQRREREQWTRSQVLLAQYQERFRAAQEVYETLIPAKPPTVPGLELAARWRPALQEGGGDFYDAVVLPSGRVALAIADVAGKSARGAMKLPLLKAAFHAAAQVWEDPGDILTLVNRIVYEQLQPEMFITACVVVIDPATHMLAVARAGQDPPVVVRAADRDTLPVHAAGLVLGVDAKAVYVSETFALASGDTLCLYTDGITEARSPEGEEFGYQEVEARVQAAVARDWTADDIAENLFEAVAEHARGEARRDDATVLVVRCRPAVPADGLPA